MAVKLTILASGSAGNCAHVETDETRVLVDAGLSPRQTRLRLASIGRAPENLNAILITHEHSDHVAGLAGLAEKLRVPVYCNRATQDEILRMPGMKQIEFRIFASGAGFEVGDIQVETFSIPHDAQDPVGFLLRTSSGTLGFATDLGHVTRLVAERVRSLELATLSTETRETVDEWVRRCQRSH